MSTVRKAASLLELFTMAEPELGLSELARRSKLDKATTRRLLVALASHRLIEQEPASRRYRLGAGLSRLARIRDANFPFARIAIPVMKELSAKTGETVHLSEFSAGALLTVHVELSARANRVNVNAGQILPLHGTASGLAVLASMQPDIARSYLGGLLEAFTTHTLTDRRQLVEQVRLTAARGYSRSAQGYEDGVHSVAASILGSDGQPIGALSVASPMSRADDAVAAAQGRAVRVAAREIAASLTGEPHLSGQVP